MSVDDEASSKLRPDVLIPKPVPVTVIRVPPELPVDGETETRVGTIVAVRNEW